jgi:hypothetical protein
MMDADRKVRHSGTARSAGPGIQKHILNLHLDSGFALRAPRNDD